MLRSNSTITKVEEMDIYFDSFEHNISSSEICNVVNQIFGIDLDAISVLPKGKADFTSPATDTSIAPSRSLIDSYLCNCKKNMTGSEIRKMINQIFGVNLDGIASLEKAKISLFSKGQWVVQNEKDLFVVRSGNTDVDVSVSPTKYFIEQTKLQALPNDLIHLLTNMGFYYNEQIGSYYFSNPNDEAVPDNFKGQTLGAIIKVIQNSYSHL